MAPREIMWTAQKKTRLGQKTNTWTNLFKFWQKGEKLPGGLIDFFSCQISHIYNTIFFLGHVAKAFTAWVLKCITVFFPGLYAVSSWARVSGSDSATREDGPLEQNRFRLPGDNFDIYLLSFLSIHLCGTNV